MQPGTLAAAGLVAPEFQITDDTTAILVPNFLGGLIFTVANPNSVAGQSTFSLNLTTEQGLVGTPSALLDHLSLVMTGGQLSSATRNRITTSLSTLGAATSTLERAQTAILLIATSPDGATQK